MSTFSTGCVFVLLFVSGRRIVQDLVDHENYDAVRHWVVQQDQPEKLNDAAHRFNAHIRTTMF